MPGIEIEIRDDRGVAVTSGTVGRIWVRGSQVTSEYDGRPDADDRAGWFDTRDAGSLDDEGYLYIEGRIDDTIIRGAENIAPAEIEDHLLRHPAVGDAAVVGVPDDEWGQRIEAVVVARPGAALDDIAVEELRSGVRLALRSSKTPDRIQVWAELPRTDTGKLLRREIVARLTT